MNSHISLHHMTYNLHYVLIGQTGDTCPAVPVRRIIFNNVSLVVDVNVD